MIDLQDVKDSYAYYVRSILPSGVTTMSGFSYGVNLTNPSAVSPAVYILLDEIGNADVELGSFGMYIDVVLTINALSSKQRDAIKMVLFNGINNMTLRLYDTFTNGVPSDPIGAIDLVDRIRIQDTQSGDFSKERLFWVSTLYARYNILE